MSIAATQTGHCPTIFIRDKKRSLFIKKLHPGVTIGGSLLENETFNFFQTLICFCSIHCLHLYCSIVLLAFKVLVANAFLFLDRNLLYLFLEPILNNDSFLN